MARAKTFLDDKTVEVEIVSNPSSTGLCKVKTAEGKVFARHVDRLEAIDDGAREILLNTKWSPYTK